MTKNLILACVGLTLFVACAPQPPLSNQQPAAAPSGPAAAVATTSYQGVGVVKSLNPKRPGIEINHEDIPGLMPAMEMEFPVTDAALLSGISVNDRIDFTVENGTGEMRITAIKKK